MNKKIKQSSKYALVLIIGILIGTLTTYVLTGNREVVQKNQNNSIFNPLFEAYNKLNEEYYSDFDNKTLINGAIKGLVDSLGDQHTMFFDEEEKKEFEEELAGEYYGIGAQIQNTEDDKVVIVKVFKESPAEKAGLESGDIFVSIDGESTEGMDSTAISKNLRSESKEITKIVISRNGEEKEFTVEKDNIELESVYSEMIEDGIGYIMVDIFGERTAEEFEEALIDLEKNNLKSLIIDLRYNSGGYLGTVSKMLSEFLGEDKVIFQIKTKEGIQKYTSLDNNTRNYKIIVLVNEYSASASEIMCSALQEQYGATLVGKTTYGKGTVQTMFNLSNGTLIKYTIQEWLTSNGNSINEIGVKPDVEVELSEEYMNDPTDENDNQLQKAIELAR